MLPYLRPDGKTQVTIRYEVDEHGRQRPVEIERVLISTQHREGLEPESEIKPDLIEHVLRPILPPDLYDEKRLGEDDFVYVNPTGKFVIGGPMGDTGLTGRKIIVDTYGGAAPHGGGAFSGKDPTKVDRSAAYAARYVAKNVVAAGLADRCQIQVAYAIGVAHPFSILVDCFGTETVPGDADRGARPRALRPAPGGDPPRPRPAPPDLPKTAAYGHFGRDGADFTGRRPTRPTPSARPPGSAPPRRSEALGGAADGRRPDEEAGGGLLADRLLAAVQADAELARRGLRGLELDRRARDEALVVEPVQQVAVVLGEPDDRRARRPARAPRAARARGSRPARRRCRSASRAGSGRGCRAARRSARPCRR